MMPRSKARLSASRALSSSLYMRKRLPPPMARIETRAPVRPRTRVGIAPVAARAAAPVRAAVPRKSRRDIFIWSAYLSTGRVANGFIADAKPSPAKLSICGLMMAESMMLTAPLRMSAPAGFEHRQDGTSRAGRPRIRWGCVGGAAGAGQIWPVAGGIPPKRLSDLVDLVRFELTTSSMPWKRAPNCATGPFA